MRIVGACLWLGVVLTPLGLNAGCVSGGAHARITARASPVQDAPPDLPEPRAVHNVDPVTTLDPFLLAVPAVATCAKTVEDRAVSDNATVDPFCLAQPQPRCIQPSGMNLSDDEGIIDPFCGSADNGG